MCTRCQLAIESGDDFALSRPGEQILCLTCSARKGGTQMPTRPDGTPPERSWRASALWIAAALLVLYVLAGVWLSTVNPDAWLWWMAR